MTAHETQPTHSPLLVDGQPVEDWFRAQCAQHGVVGASLALQRGDAVQTAATGLLNLDTGVEVTPESVFQIGSITKLFTATLVMQLVEAGRLELDDPVQQHLPEFCVADAEASRSITVRQLLNHTSGMQGDFFPADDPQGPSARRYLAKMRLLPQLYAPGQGPMTYCNSGYTVLGRLIEVLTGLSYNQALMQRICTPLEMQRAFVDPQQSLRFRCAMGHLPDPDDPRTLRLAPIPYLMLSSTAAGTALSMSASELLRFAAVWFADGAPLLGAAAAARMQSDSVPLPAYTRRGYNRWGLGWMIGEWPECTVIGHDGATLGQYAYLRIFPRQRCAFSLLTNSPSAKLYESVEASLMRALAVGQWPADPDPIPGQAAPMNAPGVYENLATRYRIEADAQQLRLTLTDKAFGTPDVHAELRPIQPDVLQPDSTHPALQTPLCLLRDGESRVEFLRAGVRMARKVN